MCYSIPFMDAIITLMANGLESLVILEFQSCFGPAGPGGCKQFRRLVC
jgi:hypothetical protein